MKFKKFMEMYDNWNGVTKVNDDNLDTIVFGHTLEIMECIPTLNGVENYAKLFEMEVVAFGFYDDYFCVRVKEEFKAGDLIAVEGNLYDYIGYDEGIQMHKVAVVDIDEEGILTNTHSIWYFTDAKIAHRGIDLTEKQWLGLTKHFIRQEHDLTEEEISEAAEDIVCRCFATTRVPLVEELPNYIAIYLDR